MAAPSPGAQMSTVLFISTIWWRVLMQAFTVHVRSHLCKHFNNHMSLWFRDDSVDPIWQCIGRIRHQSMFNVIYFIVTYIELKYLSLTLIIMCCNQTKALEGSKNRSQWFPSITYGGRIFMTLHYNVLLSALTVVEHGPHHSTLMRFLLFFLLLPWEGLWESALVGCCRGHLLSPHRARDSLPTPATCSLGCFSGQSTATETEWQWWGESRRQREM